jgi:hypothetical protein
MSPSGFVDEVGVEVSLWHNGGVLDATVAASDPIIDEARELRIGNGT